MFLTRKSMACNACDRWPNEDGFIEHTELCENLRNNFASSFDPRAIYLPLDENEPIDEEVLKFIVAEIEHREYALLPNYRRVELNSAKALLAEVLRLRKIVEKRQS